MRLTWNNKTALISYIIIGILGAAVFRLSCGPKDNTLPVGKSVHLMPISSPPQGK